MTFTTRLKDELTQQPINPVESLIELSAYIKNSSQIKKDAIIITIENASVARRVYKIIKYNFGVNIKITVRIQKRFRIKQIYILEIFEKLDEILEALNITKNGKKNNDREYFVTNPEEQKAYIKGVFFACGSINDPSSGEYHCEFSVNLKSEGLYIKSILNNFNIKSKIIKRANKYMVYIKAAEMISDLLKILNATNCFFYYEDIRIYRDHKNMVNRLNNCEIANQEKILNSALKQLQDIEYLHQNDLIGLLDDNVKEAIKYREAYPETSLQELADIITTETGRKIGKSGINHYFIKVKQLVEKHKSKNNDQS